MEMSNLLTNPLEINLICRACLGRKGDMRPLFGSCLDEMLMSFANVQVKEGDGLPHLMCVQCVLQVSRAFTFKQLCEKSAATLQLFVSEEFQEQLAMNDKTLENADIDTLILPDQTTEECIIEDFSPIDMAGELTLDESGVELKQDNPLESLEDDNFDAYSDCGEETGSIKEETCDEAEEDDINEEVTDRLVVAVKPDQVLQFGEHTVLAIPSDTPSHIIEIRPDGTTHLIPREDASEELKMSTNKLSIQLKAHNSKMDPQGKHKCPVCGDAFNMKVDLKLHMIIHPSENVCDVCNKTFPEPRALKRHLKTHLVDKPHKCDTCGKSFAESSNLNKHKKRHTGELRNVQGKPHLCSVCGRGFKWATSLSKHFKYHTGRKLLCCKYCPKQYVEARSLRIHVRSHTGEKPYICTICNKGFTQRCNLEKHIRVHTGEKPHLCNICGKGFSQRGYVTIHMRTHTGEKPYSCQTCGKGFAGANTLNIHRRTHTGEKPFACDVCHKLFGRQETLIIHQRTHTGERPHICTVCNRGFTSSGHLTGHMRSHTGVKPHVCSVCDKRFAGSSSLKVHMRLHTGEKPYMCDLCGKGFSQSSALANHHASHAKGESNSAPAIADWTTDIHTVNISD